MTDKKKIESTKHPTKIPKDVLTTIPFTRVYDDTNTDGGIIEISNGLYSKSYYLDDTSFSDLGDEEQDDILKSFERILNTFNHLYSYEITVNIRNIDKSKFNETILMQYKKDELDDLRAEHNEIILDKMQEGKNNLKAEKYITISVEGENIKDLTSLKNAPPWMATKRSSGNRMVSSCMPKNAITMRQRGRKSLDTGRCINMLLLITFPNETMPFIEDGLSEEECIRAINKAKELGWEFQENRYVVESDRIIIHAWKRNPTRETRKKKRYYIFGDKVLLVTSLDCPEEILAIKELLSYEKGISVNAISAVEI